MLISNVYVLISQNTDVEEELCILCDEGGETVLCDTCLNSYHATCHQPPLRAIPRLVNSSVCHLDLPMNTTWN